MTVIVRDLLESKELDSKAMAAVRGGNDQLLLPSFPSVINTPNFTSNLEQNQFAFVNIKDNDVITAGKGSLIFDYNDVDVNQFQQGQAVS